VNVLAQFDLRIHIGFSASTTQVVGKMTLTELKRRGTVTISYRAVGRSGTLGFLIPPIT
jgi:TRAP-type C4-dicarboxylate transport system permease large subunit